MRIVDVPKPGGPEALIPAEREVPVPGPGEVLIKVAAAGLNRADILQRQGAYPAPPGAPTYPGMEVSGTVAAIGAGVQEFRVGEPVCALLQGGGYAEFALAPLAQVLPIPAGIPLIVAAALPEAYFTVWSNIFVFARFRPAETLLVHGGSSGIGVTAIQLASVLGGKVFATAGTDEKCRYCESLGAVKAINYRTEDFVAAVKKGNADRGVNVVLDMVGGEYTQRNIEVLAEEGRLVIIATQGGTRSSVDLRSIMRKRLIITGSTLRGRPASFKQEIKRELLEHVWPLLASRRLRVIVDKTFPLEAAADAHRYMESGAHIGKILLTVDQP